MVTPTPVPVAVPTRGGTPPPRSSVLLAAHVMSRCGLSVQWPNRTPFQSVAGGRRRLPALAGPCGVYVGPKAQAAPRVGRPAPKLPAPAQPLSGPPLAPRPRGGPRGLAAGLGGPRGASRSPVVSPVGAGF